MKHFPEFSLFIVDVNNFKTDMDDSELPPTDFMVSPNMSPASSLSSSDMSLSTDILHKRGCALYGISMLLASVIFISWLKKINWFADYRCYVSKFYVLLIRFHLLRNSRLLSRFLCFFLVELVFDVMRAVEVLVKHFSQTRDATRKVRSLLSFYFWFIFKLLSGF